MPASGKETYSGTFTKSRETKGTWVYVADDDTNPMTNFYLQKAGLDKVGSAEKVKVTIEKVG